MANQPNWDDLDSLVARLYRIGALDRQTIADTLATRSPFPTAKKHAAKRASTKEAEQFRAGLKAGLSDVLGAGGHKVSVSLLAPADAALPWRFIAISLNHRPVPPNLPARWVEQADDLSASRITIIDSREPCLIVGVLDRYRYWTPTQARLLAADLLWQHGALLEKRART